MGAARRGGTEIVGAGGACAALFAGPEAWTGRGSAGPSVAFGLASRFLRRRGCACLGAARVRPVAASTGRSSAGGTGRGAVAAAGMNSAAAGTGSEGTSMS